jgi:alkyl sulfatase BDS1-like metallo-beta-lactamase superfamily hydrolase
MSDPCHDFFDQLRVRKFDARLGRVKGTIRFDVIDSDPSEHWLVSLDRGAIRVSRDDESADCVVRADRATLDGVVAGEINVTAAIIRGVVGVTGNIDVLLHLQRLFPAGPDPRARNPKTAVLEAS